ncbi:hypothetical protein [Streptomyces olivaceus]|uniref:hypothetical protein n=1 Tax=Streptomyces olivaceus TaxID=47716 RepID=UPI0004C8D444|nr:hypothetical protein [Streptomyces olivaceus]MBZ6102722.1 hypothetical protein [Streptomyces olivaceus]
MPAAFTVDGLVQQHAHTVAYLAHEPAPATTAAGFIAQLGAVAAHLEVAGIVGHHDLKSAARLISEAADEQSQRREVLLQCAALCLAGLGDMADEYRDMAT